MGKEVFKVGDRVRGLINVGCECNTKGIKGTVTYIDSGEAPYAVEFDKNINGHNLGICGAPTCKDKYGWWCKENEIELCNPSIHITVDGAKVLAVMKDGKQEVGRGVATCNPSDEFDFKVGAKLAIGRLLGEEIKGDYVTAVREVRRKARVGEYIKIVKPYFSFNEVGDILKVDGVIKDSERVQVLSSSHPRKPNAGYREWNYPSRAYVVLENYNPENPVPASSITITESTDEYLSFKKVKRRAEVGEYVLIVNAENVPGEDYKDGDILKITESRCRQVRYAKGLKGDKDRVLNDNEYVVLEGYQPPKSFDVLTKEKVLKAVEKALEK